MVVRKRESKKRGDNELALKKGKDHKGNREKTQIVMLDMKRTIALKKLSKTFFLNGNGN